MKSLSLYDVIRPAVLAIKRMGAYIPVYIPGCISERVKFWLQPFYLSANLFCLCKGGKHASSEQCTWGSVHCMYTYTVYCTVCTHMLLSGTLGFVKQVSHNGLRLSVR